MIQCSQWLDTHPCRGKLDSGMIKKLSCIAPNDLAPVASHFEARSSDLARHSPILIKPLVNKPRYN